MREGEEAKWGGGRERARPYHGLDVAAPPPAHRGRIRGGCLLSEELRVPARA